jgi:dTDP-4-dehydrorhamnose 3,5-epimerase-like enzyme
MQVGIDKIRIIELPHHFEENGELIVLEENKTIPFHVLRVFVVKAPKGAIRGEHSHKQCTQLLNCPSGQIELFCDDGRNKCSFNLNRPNIALLIPPGIWAQQIYVKDNSVLTVLCDHFYEPDDYIRDYSDFLISKNS